MARLEKNTLKLILRVVQRIWVRTWTMWNLLKETGGRIWTPQQCFTCKLQCFKNTARKKKQVNIAFSHVQRWWWARNANCARKILWERETVWVRERERGNTKRAKNWGVVKFSDVTVVRGLTATSSANVSIVKDDIYSYSLNKPWNFEPRVISGIQSSCSFQGLSSEVHMDKTGQPFSATHS